jgi:proton-coupled amino acid transporter
LDSGGGDLRSALLGTVKAMVGPAILYLPHGFVAAGYAAALPIMMIATVLYWHSSASLLQVWRVEVTKELVSTASDDDDDNDDKAAEQESLADPPLEVFVDEPSLADTHTDTIHHHNVTLSYPDLALRAFGTPGETLVKVGIALMQSGVCLTYLIFVPHNVRSSLHNLTGWHVPTAVCLLFMVGVQIPLAWIREIRHFRNTNALANALIVYGLVVCLGFALQAASSSSDDDENDTDTADDDTPTRTLTTTMKNASDARGEAVQREDSGNALFHMWQHLEVLSPWGDHWILFIGTAVLLFEGSITLLLPLQQAITHTPDRVRFPTVYPQVILAIQVFYFFFAITCWMGFGDDVNTVLTTSLPAGLLATTVQLAYSVAVLLTFPLQNYPALEIACHALQEQLRAHPYLLARLPHSLQGWIMKRDVIAAVLVCLLAVVALLTMDSLDKVASLTGALVGIPIAFMIPPMIHNQLMPDLTPLRRQQNYAVTLLGFAAMVLASVTTIYQWND